MELEKKIIRIIEENIESDTEVNLDSKLFDDLEVDSLGVTILLNAFEDEMDLEINDKDFRDIVTVRDIIEKISDIRKGS
ncbi:acyl carrier protein [Alkaliphilus peptidifermentans]|uniref:Phosphopantetheine attachment site n=1 Tax=Alkaliphilus peptidifermentans DSM 18978 TaxID=1120976 RepID=A0A1G5IAQ6_9FIRM|nr:phosphopantetheine-binding protein [Alkaliphilus peptidifermentans]SCY72740.1 Phosphopantetheine attachment site [Alkaliphilus peptidifermentans DSM 18978]